MCVYIYIYISCYFTVKTRFRIFAYSHITNPFSPISRETYTLKPGLHGFSHRKEAPVFPHGTAPAAAKHPPPPAGERHRGELGPSGQTLSGFSSPAAPRGLLPAERRGSRSQLCPAAARRGGAPAAGAAGLPGAGASFSLPATHAAAAAPPRRHFRGERRCRCNSAAARVITPATRRIPAFSLLSRARSPLPGRAGSQRTFDIQGLVWV